MKRFIGLSRVSTAGFLTFQTPSKYEEAIARHGQYFRWISGTLCGCLNPTTGQPDYNHSVCKGRGKIYAFPGDLHFRQEAALSDNYGRVYLNHTPVVQSLPYYCALRGSPGYPGAVVPIDPANQPPDGSYIQLLAPFPPKYSPIIVDYWFDPTITVTGEDSTVYDSTKFVLKTLATNWTEKGRNFKGSIESVQNVTNVTKNETYTVASFELDMITLAGMGSWQLGDVLSVDYEFVKPFNFVIVNVTPKMRFEATWVMEAADAILYAPSFCDLGIFDVLTMQSGDVTADTIIDPTVTPGNDVVANYFDIYELNRLVDSDGNVIDPSRYFLYGRNQIAWIGAKPTGKYTAVFHYHPVYTILEDKGCVTTHENKAFFSRYNVKIFDRPAIEVNF